MVYLRLAFMLVLISISISSNAQAGGWMLGVGPSFEANESLIGGNARMYYGTGPRFCFGPEVSIFPFQEIDEENELSITELNVNAHYVFEITEQFGAYPLAGFNYTNERERLISNDNIIEKQYTFGVNYGLGVHYNLEPILLFSEFKGVVSQLSDTFLTLGIIIVFED